MKDEQELEQSYTVGFVKVEVYSALYWSHTNSFMVLPENQIEI